MYYVCIKKSGWHTTIGKKYYLKPALPSSLNKVKAFDFVNDLGIDHLIWQDDLDFAFIKLNEYRKIKLKRILNEVETKVLK